MTINLTELNWGWLELRLNSTEEPPRAEQMLNHRASQCPCRNPVINTVIIEDSGVFCRWTNERWEQIQRSCDGHYMNDCVSVLKESLYQSVPLENLYRVPLCVCSSTLGINRARSCYQALELTGKGDYLISRLGCWLRCEGKVKDSISLPCIPLDQQQRWQTCLTEMDGRIGSWLLIDWVADEWGWGPCLTVQYTSVFGGCWGIDQRGNLC